MYLSDLKGIWYFCFAAKKKTNSENEIVVKYFKIKLTIYQQPTSIWISSMYALKSCLNIYIDIKIQLKI